VEAISIPNRPYSITAEKLLHVLKLRKIRRRGNQIEACCPFHDDRVPSFSMNARTSQWFCHACNIGGNGATLLAEVAGIDTRQAHARLMEGDPWKAVRLHAPYVRKTDRVSGSKQELQEQLRRARHFLESTRMSRSQAAHSLSAQFGVSVRTAYRWLGIVSGTTPVQVKNGVRHLVRGYHVLKQLRLRQAARLFERGVAAPLQDEKLSQLAAEDAEEDVKASPRKPRGPSHILHGRVRTRSHAFFNPVWA
jgi:hypothetical protein